MPFLLELLEINIIKFLRERYVVTLEMVVFNGSCPRCNEKSCLLRPALFVCPRTYPFLAEGIVILGNQ